MSESRIEFGDDGVTVQNFLVDKESGGMVRLEAFANAVIIQLVKVYTDDGEKIAPTVSLMVLDEDMKPALKEYAHVILRSIR